MKHREYLYRHHSEDLSRLIPSIVDIFICPICLGIFYPNSIGEGLVDVGHVWPRYFRERSEQAKHQQVLLCKRCNSNAGNSGDKIMSLDAEMRESSKNLGLRRIRVTNSSLFRGEVLDIEAYVQRTGDASCRLTFPQSKKKEQKRYLREQKEKVHTYLNGSPVTLTIYPPKANPRNPFGDPRNDLLVQAGFLTSAYLLAFFKYGYRYILQTCLDPVREYIQQSFDKNVDGRLEFEKTKDVCVQLCDEPSHFCRDPEIAFVITNDENIPIFHEVRFLNYHIRLPVPPIFVGEDRLEVIGNLCKLSGQIVENIEEVQSIASRNIFISNLDHPLILQLRELTQ